MTAILAVQGGDAVMVLGRDTMTADDASITYADDKVFETELFKHFFTIGTAGDVGAISTFRLMLFQAQREYRRTPRANREEVEVGECLLRMASILRTAAGSESAQAIVIHKMSRPTVRKIYVLDQTGAVVGPCQQASVGDGGPPAEAALSVLRSVGAADRLELAVRQAIEEAAKVVPGVGGEIVVEVV